VEKAGFVPPDVTLWMKQRFQRKMDSAMILINMQNLDVRFSEHLNLNIKP
jgi:hypothetical protein